MKLSKGNRDLILHGSLVKAVFAIAIPVVVNSFLQTMYNLTDTYWLGQLSVDYLAAINLVSPVQNTVINFGSGVTVAGAVMISQYIGAGKPEMARKIANQIFTVAMLFSLLCASVMAVATPGIVGWMGAAPDYFDHAVTYMRLVVLDMPFLFMVNIYQSIRQAQGDTVRPMLLNLLGIAVNMVLDPLLMVVLHWNAAGAALATVFAKMVPACIAFFLLCTRRDEAICFDRRFLRPDAACLARHRAYRASDCLGVKLHAVRLHPHVAQRQCVRQDGHGGVRHRQQGQRSDFAPLHRHRQRRQHHCRAEHGGAAG